MCAAGRHDEEGPVGEPSDNSTGYDREAFHEDPPTSSVMTYLARL